MAPQAPRAVRAPVTFKKQKDHHSGLCDLQSPISNLQRVIFCRIQFRSGTALI